MKILALEFSSAERSVAILERNQTAPVLRGSRMAHQNERLTGLALIDEALQVARVQAREIDLIAIGLGPGSYAGIRSAIAIAQGWQLGSNVKVRGISSIQVLARQAHDSGATGEITIVVDAQKGELHAARYLLEKAAAKELEAVRIVSPSDLSNDNDIIGPEASRFIPNATDMAPSAAVLAQLASEIGTNVPAELLQPIYLRETSFVKAPPPRTFHVVTAPE